MGLISPKCRHLQLSPAPRPSSESAERLHLICIGSLCYRRMHSGVHWLELHSLGQQSQLLMFMLQTPTFRKRASCPALLTMFRLQTLPLYAALHRQASAFTVQLMSKEHTFLKPASLLFISHRLFKADPACIAVFSF